MPVFANTFLFSFKQAHICNDSVILFLRPAVSRPHTEKNAFNVGLTCRRSNNVMIDEGQFVINVYSVVPEVHRISSIRSCELMTFHLQHACTWTPDSHQNWRRCQFPSPCSVTSYGPRIWTASLAVVVPPLRTCLVQWEKFGSRALIAFFQIFLF